MDLDVYPYIVFSKLEIRIPRRRRQHKNCKQNDGANTRSTTPEWMIGMVPFIVYRRLNKRVVKGNNGGDKYYHNQVSDGGGDYSCFSLYSGVTPLIFSSNRNSPFCCSLTPFVHILSHLLLTELLVFLNCSAVTYWYNFYLHPKSLSTHLVYFEELMLIVGSCNFWCFKLYIYATTSHVGVKGEGNEIDDIYRKDI